MALIGSVVNQGSMQGQINEANGNLTGLISSAELIGGQVVGMRGLKGDKGAQGDPGADGQDGADGYSPSASVVKVGDTATITITDKDGTTTATVEDGADGQDGNDGADGHSPVITANKVGKVTTVYVDGVAIATINDGQDGGGSGVFIAEIGTTSYSDIDTAFQGGKLVIGRVSGTGDTYFPLVVDNSSYYNYYSFQVTSGKFVFEYKIDNTDEWTTSQYVIATDDETTTSKKGLMSSSDKTKLNGIASGAEVNVQSDWNQSVNTADDYIKNKPTIPTSLSDLSDDSTHRLVTDTEKSTWNGKSDFSGDYDDLTNKPTIPTNTSDLVNDSGFLTSESIFIAEKDVTTYAEITAALNAGKTVFAKTSNSYSTFNLYTYAFDNGTSYYFYRQHGGAQVNMLNVDNTDTWSSGSTSLVTTDKPIVHEHFTLPSRSFPADAAYWFASNNIAVPTKTGYTAVGIVGASSYSNYILVNPLINDSDPTKLYGFARNLHTSAVSTTIEFDVLYVRTDLL